MAVLTSLEGVRSLKRGDVDIEEIAALAALAKGDYPKKAIANTEAQRKNGHDVEAYLVDGDLHVAGNLKASSQHARGHTLLIVRGDLVVDGVFVDSMRSPEVLTVVGGDFSARDAVNHGFLEVQGNLTVSQCLVGIHNHCSSEIFGNVEASFFWPHHHFFRVHGLATFAAAVGGVWGNANVARPIDKEETFGVIKRELLEVIEYDGEELEDPEVDHIRAEALAEELAAGRSILV